MSLSEDAHRQDGVGEPDQFERLWVPYRMTYIAGPDKVTDKSEQACPFCRIPTGSDEDGLIVHRGETCYAVLNLFPYAPGHVLVCTYRHVADYTDITDAERDEMSALTAQTMRVIRQVSSPDGFNLGMNQGDIAGAGIAAHIHQHIVPRWKGDQNFMPIIGHTKPLPQLLADTRAMFAEAWVA